MHQHIFSRIRVRVLRTLMITALLFLACFFFQRPTTDGAIYSDGEYLDSFSGTRLSEVPGADADADDGDDSGGGGCFIDNLF